jgi:NACHT domain-containing protein
VLAWLLGAAVGPATVALPINWAADALASSAQRWFRRLRRTDDLSRLVTAATGASVDLTHAEFDAVKRLLEDPQTWSMAGRGTVEDLVTQIADGLPPRLGRTADDSRAIALTAARGLLEFAVADLEPKLFQQVLLTRLQRMETGQASSLDNAMFELHADLITRFSSVMEQLKRVLDRLPPGPAQRPEIAVYLKTLIDWLNTDPWPRDRRFAGPVLTAATIERKLRVTADEPDGKRHHDADELAKQCQRLVILGGPGSGKTWLAKRTVRRCAEQALRTLAGGGTLNEAELPLYTTCSQLFTANGDIRQAVVSSALDQLGDMGGSRVSAAVRAFFTERSAPILLVIDSLDEAHGSDERLRQADTLPWRIVLTSRPTSWSHQITIEEGNSSHQVGELQPLRYPEDVEPFIHRWFAQQPEPGNDLALQIARRPNLQQAATVPLILAFYCIIGGNEPLPVFRRDLYTRALNRILTGRWRDSGDRSCDLDTCLPILRAWAWDGATYHPLSGIGTWEDEITTERSRLSRTDEDALDHVAAPIGPADLDTGQTRRRFIHRSIREHLVAEHVAALPVDQAVEALLPHLWFDPDWEYSAPAAIAMHPEHDQLLRDLICRAAGSDKMPEDLSIIDGGREFRALLARVAAESRESDWAPESAALIGDARAVLARSAFTDDLSAAVHWETSNRRVCEVLLELLTSSVTTSKEAARLADGIVQLHPAAEDRRRACTALTQLLADHIHEPFAARLVPRVVQLAETTEEKHQACVALLEFLAIAVYHGPVTKRVVDGVVKLTATAEDKPQVRSALLTLMADQNSGSGAEALVNGLLQLDPTAEDKRQARSALLTLMADQNNGSGAEDLVNGLLQLDPAVEDKHRAREVLLGILTSHPDGRFVSYLVESMLKLAATAEDKRQARVGLIKLLAVGQYNVLGTANLVEGIVKLAVTAEDKRQARSALLELLVTGKYHISAAAGLARAILELGAIADDKRQARTVLLELLDDQADGSMAPLLAERVAQLDPTAEDKRQAREALVGLLAGEPHGIVAAKLAEPVAQLDPTVEDMPRIREVLLGLLADATDHWIAEPLVHTLVELAATAEDKRQAREALIGLLAGEPQGEVAAELADGVAQLDPTAEDKRQVREALVSLLTAEDDGEVAAELVERVAQLDATAEEKRRARVAVVGLLAHQADRELAFDLVHQLALLDPTVNDLKTWHTWSALTPFFLSTVRRNSTLTEWLTALPSLAALSDS